MTLDSTMIGLNQRIRIEWLQYTANLVLAGNTKEDITSALQEYLKDKLSVGGTAIRSNRGKAISILMRIWINTSDELAEFRQTGLDLLKALPRPYHIAIHWGMTMAVYPFWGAVASQTGRLLRLQGTASAPQIQRRVREQFGERETVSRAARRIIRSFIDWQVLTETQRKGVYQQASNLKLDKPELIAWLIEALLHAQENSASSLNMLFNSPMLFPFHLMPITPDNLMSLSPGLEVHRHGLDEDLVVIRA
jgi:hypothetical protein